MNFLRFGNGFSNLAVRFAGGRRRLATVLAAVSIGAALLAPVAGRAQDFEPEATTPAAAVAEPQYSSLSSTNNVIQGTRVPVFYNGNTYYVDLTLTLEPEVTISTKGVATVTATATVVATPSPNPIVNNFKAGTYVSPSNINGGTTYIVVSGPSPLAGGGSGWTITTNSKSTPQTYPSSATWYVESNASNPLAARIKAAGITSTAYSYGVGDAGSNWDNNSLLGFLQVGNSLEIVNFTSYGNDNNTPQDTITYTLVP